MLVTSSVVAMSRAMPASAAVSSHRTDLRVLLLDDNSPWVDAIQSEMAAEGVPVTAVPLASASRPVITDAFLSSGDEAFYQAVIGPDAVLARLSAAELSSLRAYEAKFGIREVDMYNWANPTIGLNYADLFGNITTVASVTAAGKADGFGYLNGPVPLSSGGTSYIGRPLDAATMPAGATFTTLVSAPLPGGATGSLVGVYSNAGLEQMMITTAFNVAFPEFKYLAHGIVSWATRGVHFGYNRNNFTFHVDDAFASDASWDPTLNCTPGEDCLLDTSPTGARMTPDDVTYAVNWMQTNNYQLTLAFNGFYADPVADPLTQSLVANKAAFRWLNHGFEHIFQGCVQNFTVTPWQCTVANGQIVWETQANIYNEIENNIALGNTLGLSFDPTEYLSGEHSGLFFVPQQPADNPNFVAALTQAGIAAIGSDASRDNVARQVGSATTIPRHPTALYYNTSTQAQAVDEYNWLYNSRANGGSGYCEDNPGTATCLAAPLNPATGFTSYIVPTDAAYDMTFILSNDPRPFYAHTSNLTGDRLAYHLLDTILGTYRSVFTADTPLVELTLNQASTELVRQTQWASTGSSSVTGYVQNGQITISNPAGVAVPLTAPVGTTVNGAVLQPYGGEVSAWLPPASTTVPSGVTMTITGSTAFVVGAAGTVNVATTGVPAATVSVAGALPAGVTFSAASGSGTITGIPAAGTGGSYPLTVTAGNGTSVQTQSIVLTVAQAPQFTSAASATAVAGAPLSFQITTTGVPAATITRVGSLPSGVIFTANANGTAALSGTPSALVAGRSYPLTFTATNSAGAVSQAFTLTVASPTAIVLNVTGSTAFRVGANSTINIAATAVPTPTVSLAGALPTGVTFSAGTGTGTITGTPAAGTGGSYPVTITAKSGTLVRTQQLVISVAQLPAFTSATTASASAGTAFSFKVTTTGYPAATITRTGTLPTGVTFTAGADGTATLVGTPSTSAAGRTFAVTFTATNSVGSVRQTFTLTVGRAPAFTSGTQAMAFRNSAFSFTVRTTGTPAPAITMSGALPTGLTFVDNHDGTARISGTPARGTSRTYTLIFTAKNTYGSATRTLTLLVL
ncbi:MAG: putative Ig domain-containing protein [Ilumatobacteraceae bacterium]